MLVKNILGKEVLDSRGNLAGRVSDMEINLTTGTINQIFIRYGLSCTRSVMPDDIITAGDRIIIRHLKTDIKRVETFHFLGIIRRVLCNW